MSSQAASIEFVDVSKRYGEVAAVDSVRLTIDAGELVTLLGPSGCGKTTILRLISGLEAPSEGSVLIAGRDVTSLPASQRNVSMVFQSYALFPHLRVIDNVCYGLLNRGLLRNEARERALQAIEQVGLTGLGERWPAELSGGQQQRVALARALVLEPDVLLFDEPLSNLDTRLRRHMRDEIRALQQRLGVTAVYVTHDQAEALAVSDRVIVMDAGRIAQQGTPRELYERPGSEFVAAFMGEANLLAVTRDADGDLCVGTLKLPERVRDARAAGSEGAALRVAVRPEAWRVQAPDTAGLAGMVSKSSYLGPVVEYTIDSDVGTLFVVSSAGGRQLAPGERVTLTLEGEGIALVDANREARDAKP
ncbi:MAG: ABC transporter ATP-binding protein [Burkholderiaceae bacterium]|nr:ABC transporter ATP-binding protein [Burkholderiaceae bacterium]